MVPNGWSPLKGSYVLPHVGHFGWYKNWRSMHLVQKTWPHLCSVLGFTSFSEQMSQHSTFMSGDVGCFTLVVPFRDKWQEEHIVGFDVGLASREWIRQSDLEVSLARKPASVSALLKVLKMGTDTTTTETSFNGHFPFSKPFRTPTRHFAQVSLISLKVGRPTKCKI